VTVQQLGLVALGDSTTVGIGDPVPGAGWRGWSRLLADELAATHQLTYANLAVSGATAASVRATQLPTAARLRPQLASVVVGVNDTMRSTWDPARVHDDIVACVGGLANAGALVMTLRFHDHGTVLGLPVMLRRPLWRRIEVVNAAYDAAHSAYGGIRLDLTSESVVHERTFWSLDRLHPSELGHRLLAGAFAGALQARGYSLSCPGVACSPVPRRSEEWWWLARQGLPWLGRRANDLLPWAVRMMTVEALNRAGYVLGAVDSDTYLGGQATGGAPPAAMSSALPAPRGRVRSMRR
jgi:lysophospholipase L1-like esterase